MSQVSREGDEADRAAEDGSGVSETEKGMKVTDKRMFTAEGELREEFRHIAEERPEGTPPPEERREEARPGEPPREPRRAVETEARLEPGPQLGEGARLEIPGTPEGLGAPGFYDLASVLAEPIMLYLGDAELPDGRSVENLDMARLHIDLLDVLRQKTAGNLTTQELAFLEDLLYRLRLRYVQKRG
jgi:hypothetical protein